MTCPSLTSIEECKHMYNVCVNAKAEIKNNIIFFFMTKFCKFEEKYLNTICTNLY